MSNYRVWIDDNNVSGSELPSKEIFIGTSDSDRKNGFKAGKPASASWTNSGLRQANLVITAFMNVMKDTTTDFRSNVSAVETAIKSGLTTYVEGVKAKDYNTSNGSIKDKFANIESRLDNLGFKTGSISGNFPSGATLTKQAKYAILTIPGFLVGSNTVTVTYTGTMSFTAKEKVTFNIAGLSAYGGAAYIGSGEISGNTITLTAKGGQYGVNYAKSQIGFEISAW